MKFSLNSFLSIGALLISSVASHVTANPNTAAPGAYFVTWLRVPHGCGNSSTNKITVNFTPDLTTGATAQAVSGWKVSYGYPSSNSNSSSDVAAIPTSVTWTASQGNELSHDQFIDFGLSLKTPLTAQYNNTIYFPAVQSCLNGTNLWNGWPGNDTADSTKNPAPSLKLVNGTSVSGTSKPSDSIPTSSSLALCLMSFAVTYLF